MKPSLDDDPVDGEADPKCDPEELLWTEMCQRTCSKEQAHNGASGRDAQNNPHRSQQPPSLQRLLGTQFVKPGSSKRKQEKAVVEKHSAAFDPPANRINAHRISSDTDDASQREEPALGPAKTRKPMQDCERCEPHEN